MFPSTKKTTELDFSNLLSFFFNLGISLVPILSNLFNAATCVQTETRLQELEKQIKNQQLEVNKLKSFVATEEGYAFFTQCLKYSLSCYRKDRIRIFVSILKKCYTSQLSFDIQYHTIIMETIAKMTDSEFLLLSYINIYCKEIPPNPKGNGSDDEFYIVENDSEYYDYSFNKFLTQQNNTDCLLENEQFFLLRLSNLGVIKANRRVIESYNITPLGKQLLTHIELLEDSESLSKI